MNSTRTFNVRNSSFEDCLCVIPARAESKGVPHKNKMLINGFPLVQISVNQALKAGIPPNNVVVSTNDEFILSYFQENNFGGIIVHKRPESLCGDFSSTESALIDACENYPGRSSILLLQTTSPIRFQGRIRNCLEVYEKSGCDSLLTTTKHYDFFWSKDDDGWKSSYDVVNRPMRQSLTEKDYKYFDNGNLYITDTKVLKDKNSRIGSNPYIYPISEIEAIQIDSKFEADIVKRLIELGINNYYIEDENYEQLHRTKNSS